MGAFMNGVIRADKFKMEDGDDTHGFRINKDYAEKYNRWREKEELQKLKDRYGDNPVSESSSSEESEDEDAEALTSQVEKDWLKTLAALKSRDPKIYDKNAVFYHKEETESSEDGHKDKKERKKKIRKEKPMFLKDYERKVLLEKEGKISESEEDSSEEQMLQKNPGYFDEQEEIRKSFKDAAKSDDSDGDDLLVERKKTKLEQEAEEQEYRAWLKGQKPTVDHDSGVTVQLEPLKRHWSDPELGEGEKFLRDYILNKRYMDEDDEDRIPTYEEIVEADDNPSEDERILIKQENFERKYNFRFEEPDEEFIKSYPRTVGDSVRRKDDRRAHKRKEAKEKKEKAKRQKREEIKQLKNLKRREILAKIERLKEITGNETIGITDADIEDDFDPVKYDQLMKKVFDDSYYHGDDSEKPVFDDGEDLDLETDNWDEWTGPAAGEASGYGDEGEEYYEPHCEDPDFNMDDDYDPQQHQSYIREKKSKKGKKSKLKQALERQKPVFDPNEKTFEEYFDEFYKLDYEDMIGDLPCRFKYRQVQPNDYGLSVNEILCCKDKELNAWVSLKKMSQHRTEEEERQEGQVYSRKARNEEKKKRILASLQEKEDEDEEEAQKSPKKKRKKKKKSDSALGIGTEEIGRVGTEEIGRVGTGDIGRTRTGPRSRKRKQPATGGGVSGVEEMGVGGVEEVGVAGGLTDGNLKREKKARIERRETTDSSQGGEKSWLGSDTVGEGNKHGKLQTKKKKKKHRAGVMSDERLKAYGINPKKFKYTHLPKLKQQKKDKKVF